MGASGIRRPAASDARRPTVYGEKPSKKQEEELIELAEAQADEAEDVTEVDDTSVDADEHLEQQEEPTPGTGVA